jgi:hypothetical protein
VVSRRPRRCYDLQINAHGHHGTACIGTRILVNVHVGNDLIGKVLALVVLVMLSGRSRFAGQPSSLSPVARTIRVPGSETSSCPTSRSETWESAVICVWPCAWSRQWCRATW